MINISRQEIERLHHSTSRFILSFFLSNLHAPVQYFKRQTLKIVGANRRGVLKVDLYFRQLRRMKIESPLRILHAAKYSGVCTLFHRTGEILHAHFAECAV